MTDDPLDALTDADVAWLDRMADVLPPDMPITGSTWWWLTAPDPHLIERTLR